MALKNAGHQGKLVDMPLCEAVIVHTGVGAALSGMKPMVEIQFGGFGMLGFNALVNNAAMLRWRWGADCPMTVRIPLGARTPGLPRYHRILVCQRSWPGCVGARNASGCLRFVARGRTSPRSGPCARTHRPLRPSGWTYGLGHEHQPQVDRRRSTNTCQRHPLQTRQGRRRPWWARQLVTWGAMVHIALQAAEVLAGDGIGGH